MKYTVPGLIAAALCAANDVVAQQTQSQPQPNVQGADVQVVNATLHAQSHSGAVLTNQGLLIAILVIVGLLCLCICLGGIWMWSSGGLRSMTGTNKGEFAEFDDSRRSRRGRRNN